MTAPLEYTGHFGGFVFTDTGKRRMLLRQSEHERLLKVPRLLRRRIIGKFRPGELIRVAVTEEPDDRTGVVKQVVSRVLPDVAHQEMGVLPPAPAASCVVRVCSKKNCWRNGGREVWAALGQELAASPYADRMEIRQVGCLDRCKQAPNVDCGRRAFSNCSPRATGEIIARAAGDLSRHEVETH